MTLSKLSTGAHTWAGQEGISPAAATPVLAGLTPLCSPLVHIKAYVDAERVTPLSAPVQV